MKRALALVLLLFSLHAVGTETTLVACVKRSGGITDEGLCYDIEIKELWDANRQLSKQIETELQACTPHVVGYDYGVALQEFRASSSNWKAYIRHDCQVTKATFGQGTAYFLEVDNCEIAHLRKRNERLTELLQELVGTKKMLLEDQEQALKREGGSTWARITCGEGQAR